jgi:hypothetical protein
MSIEKTLHNEKDFPGIINEEELIGMGGERLAGMSLFQLKNKDNTKKAIYEPVYNKDNKIKSYSLRRVIDNKE